MQKIVFMQKYKQYKLCTGFKVHIVCNATSIMQKITHVKWDDLM